MRFFHISDLHIGLRLMNRDLSDDQRYILRQIVGEVERKTPDVLLIAGDIYNNAAPSAEAVEIFDEFISALVKVSPELVIMVISGNHDNASRINLFRDILGAHKIHLIGQPPKSREEYIEKVTVKDEYGDVNFYLLPFVRPSFIKNAVNEEGEEGLSYDEAVHRLLARESIDTGCRNVFVSHQYYVPTGKNPADVERMESEIVSVGNIDMVAADVLLNFDYSALGHIHKPWKVSGEYHRYCGTPLACSVSEAGQEKGIVMVDMLEKGNIKTEVLPLTPLRKIKLIRGSFEEVLKQATDDFVTVILNGNEEDIDIDFTERLRNIFPNLLEIRREKEERNITAKAEFEEELSLMEMCREFLSGLSAGEEDILKKIENELGGLADEA